MTPSSTAPEIRSVPRVVSDVRATLGEGLCWSPREQALWSVDILEHRLFRDALTRGAHREWQFDETISAVAERSNQQGLAVTLRRGLALFDPESGALARRDEPEPDRPGNRFNDGKCDPRGRFWGGTMDYACQAPSGALYSFDAAGHATRAIDLGWIVTNGPTWTLDASTMFVNDTVPARIVAYPFDLQTGAVGTAREWLRFSPADGHPDGMTTDAAGRIWIAHWGGACVTCHDPLTAAELARIPLPTAHITNVAFGGPDMTTLFISSARFELRDEQLAAQPLAGALFAVETDAVGLQANMFAG